MYTHFESKQKVKATSKSNLGTKWGNRLNALQGLCEPMKTRAPIFRITMVDYSPIDHNKQQTITSSENSPHFHIRSFQKHCYSSYGIPLDFS